MDGFATLAFSITYSQLPGRKCRPFQVPDAMTCENQFRPASLLHRVEHLGQVAVGMGFQTVVAGRSIWFRRSLSWVQPVALPHVQSNDNRKSPLLITLHINALSYLLVTVAHYCVPAKGR